MWKANNGINNGVIMSNNGVIMAIICVVIIVMALIQYVCICKYM